MNFQYYEENNKNEQKQKFIEIFSQYLYSKKEEKQYSNIIFLCIGTDKITGDCLGPLVGTKLKELMEQDNISNIDIYGTLDENVCYTNIKEVLSKIQPSDNSCIVVIDAALSLEKNIGRIFICDKETILGKGLNKFKIKIGDISIRAIVAQDYKKSKRNFLGLKNASLNEVINLSETISNGIYETIKYI